MDQVVYLLLAKKQRLAEEFLKKINQEGRLSYLESGAAKERIKKTMHALCAFLVFKNIVGAGGVQEAFSVTLLLEREWLRRPLPSAMEIAKRILDLFEEDGILWCRRKLVVVKGSGSVVTPFRAR
ncbi:MAG: hypothetical protein Q7S52_01070 [bacterium]|nr:hypothetical protein [bacterium]